MSGIGMTSMRSRQRLINYLRELGVVDEAVLSVMLSVPRHEFLEEALASHAYENAALPIGHGQTISHPLTVAMMTAKLRESFPKGMDNVLEIGTGCGYQTAVIAAFSKRVISVERITQLHRSARDRLYDLKIRNIKCLHADGFQGCSEFAPYDGILAAAVSNDVPDELIEQLKEGGRLVMPMQTQFPANNGKSKSSNKSEQRMVVVDKTATGIKQQVLDVVAFVPRLSGTI
jgi:protein-L-isoaspartate(D-aspartate) O-methyltransferase